LFEILVDVRWVTVFADIYLIKFSDPTTEFSIKIWLIIIPFQDLDSGTGTSSNISWVPANIQLPSY